MRKKLFIAGAVVFVVIGLLVFRGRPKAPVYETATVNKETVKEIVSATGRVQPASAVDLAFERSGRVTSITVEVGSKVQPGQILVSLQNADVRAQWLQATASVNQAEASLATEQARQAELDRGSRPEEIFLAETKVINAETALMDVERGLEDIRQKAAVDIANLSQQIVDVLNAAYSKGDDAVNQHLDALFVNEATGNPQLSFSVTDSGAKGRAETGRGNAGGHLAAILTDLQTLPINLSERETILLINETRLALIRDIMPNIISAIDSAAGLSATTASEYKTSVTTARGLVTTAVGNVSTHRQAIGTQKVVNTNVIATAQTAVNVARQVLAIAKVELRLKQSGTSAEELAGQAARVRQAAANVASARANVSQYAAQVEKTILRAPIAGIVTAKDAKIGEIVAANTSVISLIAPTNFETEAFVPEADIVGVTLGDMADITLDAYGDQIHFVAKVAAIDPAETIREGVSTYKVTLVFDQIDERLRSGMTANVSIVAEEKVDVIAVSQRAITTKDGKKMITLIENGQTTDVVVETGITGSNGIVEILSGIDAGKTVVVGKK